VVIISGRDKDSLENWFGSLPITLVAEHGASIRNTEGEWICNVKSEQGWRDIFKPVLDLYCQRSPGAFIEEKDHTLVWHYRNVETELGFIRSRELLDNLHHMIRNSQLHIIDGNKVIEIRIAGVDKGTIAKKLLETAPYNFTIAIGDDKTDEDMFRAIAGNGYTIKVGADQTDAQYSLANQQEVVRLLNSFVKVNNPIFTID